MEVKKVKGLLYLSVVVFFVCAGAFVVGAADVNKGPDTITLKSTLYQTHTKTPVEFSHKKHAEDYKIACQDCHHVIKDGKNVWNPGDPVQKCQECHNEPTVQGEKKLPKDQQKLNLKLAFHDNCIGCHKKVKKENKQTTAPVTCAGCHPGSGEEKE
jgi:hypothetical protein